jgi:predicted dehydrogenase
MKVLIVGAGQLGSRHLQALRNTQFDLDITVSDPSLESLKVARERYESLPEVGKHKIQYLENMPANGSWDLAIVASNAGPRKNILQHAVDKLQIKNFVIEKILFTNAADYEWAAKLTSSSLKNAWVNCCMRQMPVYQQIKNQFTDKKFNFVVSGSNYGLVTNAIHYIDYAAWLAGTTEFTLDTSMLDTTAIPSKRKGYLELNGHLKAHFKTGTVATISCFADGQLPIVVEAHGPTQRCLVFESERKVVISAAANNWVREEREAIIPYQSQLTTEVVKAFHESKGCVLPTLDESIKIHLNLLKPLKEFLVRTNQIQTEEFPFT